MKVYVNKKNEIKNVNYSSDESLVELEIDDEFNPFKGWPAAKICCYKVNIKDNRVTMMTPYKDSRWLDIVGSVASLSEENQLGEFDLADLLDENSTSIFDLADLLSNLEERVAKLEETK